MAVLKFLVMWLLGRGYVKILEHTFQAEMWFGTLRYLKMSVIKRDAVKCLLLVESSVGTVSTFLQNQCSISALYLHQYTLVSTVA